MIIITGGAGFIGSNLVAAMSGREAPDIVVCDRLGDGAKWRNLAKHDVAEIVAPENLARFLDANAFEIDAIVHLGAISSTSETDVDRVIAVNFTLSLDLWRWCGRNGVRLIYASSAATYGDGAEGFDDDGSIEGLSRLRPLNPYGWSKHLFDRRVARLVARGSETPPQWVGLKFFNVFGANEYHKQDMQSVVAKAYAAAAGKGRVKLFKSHRKDIKDGGQKRDFIAVSDCAAVILWLLRHPEVNGLFNLGTGQARSFRELAEAVFQALGKEPDIHYVDTPKAIRPAYQYFTEASMERLRRAGYTAPFLSLEDGITDYVKNFLSQPDPYR